MIIATFGEDISVFEELLVIGGIVGGIRGVVGPFVVFPSSRFSVTSVKFAFCFLFGKHMSKSERGELVLYVELKPTIIAGESRLPKFSWVLVGMKWTNWNFKCICVTNPSNYESRSSTIILYWETRSSLDISECLAMFDMED